jgi:hypothetical protein
MTSQVEIANDPGLAPSSLSRNMLNRNKLLKGK